jgi:hypothetical protein
MRFAWLVVLLAAAACCSGCLVASVHPFYEETSLEFEPALVGRWESPDEGIEIRIERGDWRSYKVSYPVRGTPVVFTGFLTRIGDSRVLDLAPGHPPDPESLLIPAHLAVRLQLLGDTLTATGLDYDWFLRETDQGRLPSRLRGVLDSRKNVVLTADTAALRAWFAAQARGGNMFGDEVRFVRRP